MEFDPDDVVKSCSRIESGMRVGYDGLRACCFGVLVAPLFWTSEQLASQRVTKEMIIDKRKELFRQLNDDVSDIQCKNCTKVVEKKYSEVTFDGLGFIDLAHYSSCNLRCNYCGFTKYNHFKPAVFDALSLLRNFEKEDVDWDSVVDFNGGEPTLLTDFDEYVEYFRSRTIRVRLYSNGVRYKQAIYDGLRDGVISWLIVSLDAGTPSTFQRIKLSSKFNKVLENITKYSHAAKHGRGMVAVKYVFGEGNCTDDDVTGFVYAMLAIRPQKIWLTFNFLPLVQNFELSRDQVAEMYKDQIEAYAKTYVLFESHGIEAVHFYLAHVAIVTSVGGVVVELAKERIEQLRKERGDVVETMLLTEAKPAAESDGKEMVGLSFTINPLMLDRKDGQGYLPWSLQGKKVVIAPAYLRSASVMDDPAVGVADIVSFVDRNPLMHGKMINDVPVRDYKELASLDADVVLVAAPKQHEAEIVREIGRHLGAGNPEIALLDSSDYNPKTFS